MKLFNFFLKVEPIEVLCTYLAIILHLVCITGVLLLIKSIMGIFV